MSTGLAGPAVAMDLETALKTALRTNPEISEAAANRRAIDFEYEQARYLNRPSLILEGRVGPEWVDSRTTRVLGNDDDVLFGRQASATLQQNLLSFGRNDAERDRQASRVDAAAFRVRERSELVSLDVIQAYLDVMRLREVLEYSDQNVAFNTQKVADLTRGTSNGVTGRSDAQQAEERLSAAKVVRSETEEALDIAESNFIRLVGAPIGRTSPPQSIAAQVPGSLEAAIAEARRNNPTLMIARTDLDTARAQYRAAKADLKPELLFELVGRAGNDINGFEERTNDVRAQLRFRHEFRGGIKSAVVQEQLNRVDEARARIMSLERNVDQLVRESWAVRNRTALRVSDLEAQVAQGTELLDSYQREFAVNRRTLLDILDSEASLFQAQSALVTARYADIFAQYRLLAATGELLDALDLDTRRESDTSLRALEDVPPAPPAETEPRRYPDHQDDTMGTVMQVAGANPDAEAILYGRINPSTIEVRPVVRASLAPAEAEAAMAALDAYVDAPLDGEPSTIVEKSSNPVFVAAPAADALSVVSVAVNKTDLLSQGVSSPSALGIDPLLPLAPPLTAPTRVVVEAPVVAPLPNEATTVTAEPANTHSPAGSADLFQRGLPVTMLSQDAWRAKREAPGARIYWDMQAVLLDDQIYLLK